MYPDALADGLRAWLSGEESIEAEASGLVLAEVLLLHRAWLRAQRSEER